jgi:hypothetical protein
MRGALRLPEKAPACEAGGRWQRLACDRSSDVKQLRCTALLLLAAAACVPPGNATPEDAGSAAPAAPTNRNAPAATTTTPTAVAPPPAPDLLRTPFEDNFDRAGGPPAVAAAPPSAMPPTTLAPGLPSTSSSAPSGVTSAAATTGDPGPDWMATRPGIWRIEGGRLCGEGAENHGIWLKRTLPTNARIEFDAVTNSNEGDIKAEFWGDGRSYATALSYTNATSYLTIYGGWHNKFHVLARINEHGNDRQQIEVDPNSDDPREKPVVAGQGYHFKIERADGKTVKWWVDGNEMLTYADSSPLVGAGHDHFGFNDWHVKLCFDNVRVVPLP